VLFDSGKAAEVLLKFLQYSLGIHATVVRGRNSVEDYVQNVRTDVPKQFWNLEDCLGPESPNIMASCKRLCGIGPTFTVSEVFARRTRHE
jgi:hypothetical protein